MEKNSSFFQTTTKGELRYPQQDNSRRIACNMKINTTSTAELDELNEVIRILTKRQENYLQLIEGFRKKKDSSGQSIQSYSLEHTHLYTSIKAQEIQRLKEENSSINHFLGIKITDNRQRMFVTRFCMRVCEIHEQGIMKLKTLQLFEVEMEKQNTIFLQRIHRLLAIEILDLEALVGTFMRHFTSKIQDELNRIKMCLVNCSMLHLDDDIEYIQPAKSEIQGQTTQLLVVIQPEVGKKQHESTEEVANSNADTLIISAKTKINTSDMQETMKQQQKFFVFYAKKFFSLYDVLSLDKNYTKNQVSQLRLGNMDKHLYELAAKNSIISDSLKEYITTATTAKARSSHSSPSTSPKRAQKNRQNYISRLLSTSFFGSETTSFLSSRAKPYTDLQGTMTQFSLIPQNSSLYLSSPEKDQDRSSPLKTSPVKGNASQSVTNQQISRWHSQHMNSPQQPQFLPIRLFSAACHAQENEIQRDQDEDQRYDENIDAASYNNKKPFVYINPQFPAFRSTQYSGKVPENEKIGNLTYVMSKSNYRQSPFQTTRKVVMVKDLDSSNPRESYLLKSSINQKATTPFREVQSNEYQQPVRPKGAVRFIKNQNKLPATTTTASQNIENSKQTGQQRSVTPNTNLTQNAQPRNSKIIKQQKEIPTPFRNRPENVQPRLSQHSVTPESQLAFSSAQQQACITSLTVPQTPSRKCSPGKNKRTQKKQQNKDTPIIVFRKEDKGRISPLPERDNNNLGGAPTEKITLTKQADFNSSYSSPLKKKQRGGISSIQSEIKELSASPWMQVVRGNEIFQSTLCANEEDADIFSDKKLAKKQQTENKSYQQAQVNFSYYQGSKRPPSAAQFEKNNLQLNDNSFYAQTNENIKQADKLELNYQLKDSDRLNLSNIEIPQDGTEQQQKSRGRVRHPSASSSFNVSNNTKISANYSYINVCDESHEKDVTNRLNTFELDQYQSNKDTLRNILSNQQIKQQQQQQQQQQKYQLRSISNSSSTNQNDKIDFLNQSCAAYDNQNNNNFTSQIPYPVHNSSKNMLQRSSLHQSSSKRQQKQVQESLVKNDNYYQGNQEGINTSLISQLSQKQQAQPSFLEVQTQEIWRNNNFMMQGPTAKKTNVNLPKIAKQGNRNTSRPSTGQAPIQIEPLCQF